MTRPTNSLLGAILLLLIVNLGLTLHLVYRLPGGEVGGTGDVQGVTADIARTWGDNVADLYNRQDHRALYALFNEQARVKISGQQLESQLEKLHGLFGDIEEHAFVNSGRLGNKRAQQYYQLLFNLRVSQNPSPATMTLSVVVENDVISLYGLRINGTAQLD